MDREVLGLGWKNCTECRSFCRNRGCKRSKRVICSTCWAGYVGNMPRPHEVAAGNTMLMNTGLQKAGACSGEGQILKLPIDNQLAQRVERKADSAITLSEFLSD